MSRNLKKVAELFRDARQALGLSQTQFARTLNISQSHLSKIESCDRDPKGSLVIQVTEMRLKALKSKAI